MIPAGLRDLHFGPRAGECPLEQLAAKVFEVLPVHRGEVLPLGHPGEDLLGVDEPRVVGVHADGIAVPAKPVVR